MDWWTESVMLRTTDRAALNIALKLSMVDAPPPRKKQKLEKKKKIAEQRPRTASAPRPHQGARGAEAAGRPKFKPTADIPAATKARHRASRARSA